jgi:hypothetical protein
MQSTHTTRIPLQAVARTPRHRKRPCGDHSTVFRCPTPNSNVASPAPLNICNAAGDSSGVPAWEGRKGRGRGGEGWNNQPRVAQTHHAWYSLDISHAAVD